MYPYDPNTPQNGPPEEPPKKHHWYRPRNVTIGAGALLVAFVAIGVAGGSDGGKKAQPVTVTSSQAAPAPSPLFTDPTGGTCPLDQAVGPYCPGDEPAPETTAPAQPVVYHKLTAHKWALITKDPDAHAGEGYTVYGEVTQFDANTGPSAFRADVGGTRQYPDDIGFVDYPTNTMLDGDESALEPVVEKDLFTAKITVIGSLSYDTQLGGSDTVPELQIDSITVTGHAES